jgi:hypothetical protein
MGQHVLKKPALDLDAMEAEIQRRLRRGKARLLISHIFYFFLAMVIIFFVI